MEEKKINRLKYTAIITLISMMLVATYAINVMTIEKLNENTPTQDEREWHLEQWGTLGSLDSAWSSGNTSILAVWVVNHSSVADIQFDTNDTSPGGAVNNSNLILGYAQKDDFDIEINHSQAFDVLVYVRANQTNAGEGVTGGSFNASYVMVNFTCPDLGADYGYNLSGIICTNTSGLPFIYMIFVFNGSQTGVKTFNGWNNALCGTGATIARNQRVGEMFINLSCYY